jgi:hypothetical protein
MEIIKTKGNMDVMVTGDKIFLPPPQFLLINI